MAKVTISLDTETQECSLMMNNMPLEYDSFELNKYYSEDGEPKVFFAFTMKEKNNNGMDGYHRYMMMTPPEEMDHDGYSEIAGVKIPFIKINDNAVSEQLKEFLESRKKKNKRKWSY